MNVYPKTSSSDRARGQLLDCGCSVRPNSAMYVRVEVSSSDTPCRVHDEDEKYLKEEIMKDMKRDVVKLYQVRNRRKDRMDVGRQHLGIRMFLNEHT